VGGLREKKDALIAMIIYSLMKLLNEFKIQFFYLGSLKFLF
jgi:hypothetical protein